MFSFNVKDNYICQCLHIIRNDSAFLQSECACLHVNSKHGSFFAISNANTYPKGRALVQMYRAVPITERGNPKNWFKVKGEN